jgi:hypothetical protein
MSKETTMNEEMMMLLKALVDKVNELEKAVYNKDNLLMKSGWTTVSSPTPSMGSADIDTDAISKMDWSDINKIVSNLETKGGY